MLKFAIDYQDKINSIWREVCHEDKYKFFQVSTFRGDLVNISEFSTWRELNYASLDKDGNVLGYISYDCDRTVLMKASKFTAINLSDNKLEFGKDIQTAIDDIFLKYNFNKLNFGCVVGNPVEKTYDKLVKNMAVESLERIPMRYFS